MQSEVFSILERVMRLCRDDRRQFTQTDRLDEIQRLLWDSQYRRVNPQGLFHLYASRPLEQIKGPIVLVSSHVDCEVGITRCFCKEAGDGLLRGTFDNAATNAAILSLMLEGSLPDSVLISFTGDEEAEGHGVIETTRFLQSKQVAIGLAIVLDVTDMGWNERASFTIENNFWDDAQGRHIIKLVSQQPTEWRFVPENPNDIPQYVPSERVIPIEADEDESWVLDELNIPCFSLCLPVNGNMHSNRGVLATKDSFTGYCSTLKAVLAGSLGVGTLLFPPTHL